MKIAYIVPHLEDGGMPKLVETMSRCWGGAYAQTVILLIGGMAHNYSFYGTVVELCPMGKGKSGKLLAVIKRIIIARRLRKNEKYDAVISFGAAANIVNILSASGGRVIITEHNIKSQENKSWGIAGYFYTVLMRLLYNRADAVVAISQEMKDDLEKNFGVRNVQKIFNPHDREKVILQGAEDLPAQYAFLEHEKYIVAAGPTDERKGFFHLVRSFSAMKKEDASLLLVIAGKKGPLQDIIEEEAAALGIRDAVIFAGYQKNPFPFIKHAALFALSSSREGLPNVLIESMILGVPAVAADCVSGPREIMGGTAKRGALPERVDCGVLAPVFDVCGRGSALSESEAVFARECTALLADGKRCRRAADACRERAKIFSADVIMRQYGLLVEKDL